MSTNRRQFLTEAGAAAAFGAAARVFGRTPAEAAAATSTVVGTGDPLIDVPAVQSAADAGGVVQLRGTFDFGVNGLVELGRNGNDVALIGEEPTASGETDPVTKTRDRQWPTVIRNGGSTDLRPHRGPLYCDTEVRIAISDVHIEEPLSSGIYIGKASYAIVSNCLITNLLATELMSDAHPGLLFAIGIRVDGRTGGIGDVVISDSVLNLNQDGAHNEGVRSGINILSTQDCSVEVTGTVIQNYAHLGILNYNAGFTRISNNRILTGAYYPEREVPDIGMAGAQGLGRGKGIAVDWYDRDLFDGRLGSSYVTGNAIQCAHPTGDGISLNNHRGNPIQEGSSHLISHNVISVEGCRSGIALSGFCRNGAFTHNSIAGTASYGIRVDALEHRAQDNVFQGNDIHALSAEIADAYLSKGADNNVLVGDGGDVVDEGDNNTIVGFTRKPPEVGAAHS